MNLLSDAIFSVTLPDGAKDRLDLPSVLAQLSAGDILSFDALQLHQEQAWYCFLVQLAAITLGRSSTLSALSVNSNLWRNALRELTAEHHADEPWKIIVSTLDKPGFMQPPVPEKSRKGFRDLGTYADSLDVLITTKNHDVKAGKVVSPVTEHWVFSLICLQTIQGYSGNKNYGVARMNRGYGSRPWIGFSVGESIGARFRRDVAILMGDRVRLCQEFGFNNHGIALLWMLPWSGDTAVTHRRLDPYFIEVCRRVRLVTLSDNKHHAFFKPTACARVLAEELKGNIGDPWTPVEREQGAALTLGEAGFDFRKLHEILFEGKYRPAACQIVRNEDKDKGEILFKGVCMVRGQSVTGGFHSRTVPIPGKVRLMLTNQQEKARVRKLSGERIEATATCQRKVLKPAILTLIQGAPEKLNMKSRDADKWTGIFQRKIDELFFPRLWDDCDTPPDKARINWAHVLRNVTLKVFEDAVGSVPIASADRYRILARAEGLLKNSMYKNFPELQQNKSEEKRT